MYYYATGHKNWQIKMRCPECQGKIVSKEVIFPTIEDIPWPTIRYFVMVKNIYLGYCREHGVFTEER